MEPAAFSGSIPYVPDEKVRTRYIELGEEFETFAAGLAEQTGVTLDIEIDSAKLGLVVLSYFNDISRYKAWHFPDNPAGARLDGTKKAAYMAYWLNKIAPISFRRDTVSPPPDPTLKGVPSDPLIMMTQFFTLHVVTNYLGFVLAEKLVAKLLYHMIYREESAKTYLLLFEMLDEVHRSGSTESIFTKH